MKNNELLKDLDRVIKDFIYTAEFVEFDQGDLPDNYTIAPDSMERIKKDCTKFLQMCNDKLTAEELRKLDENIDTENSSAGGDFFYTRNGHGVGFWDRPEIYGEELAKKLTTISESFSEVYVFLEGNVIYFE
jgi:hypothetical protein